MPCPANGPLEGGGPIRGRGTDPGIVIPPIKGCTATCGGPDKFTKEVTLFDDGMFAAPFVKFVALSSKHMFYVIHCRLLVFNTNNILYLYSLHTH